MKIAFPYYFILVLFFASPSAASAQFTSRYTDLSSKACKELKSTDEEGTSYEGECPGLSGYKLRLLEGDLRQSVDVITPARKTHQLAFWNISSAFSHIGDKAEWRMSGKIPIALIFRFNASEDPENAEKHTSYLVVAKVSKDEICVTDVIKPGRNQNLDARKAADTSATRPCLKVDSP